MVRGADAAGGGLRVISYEKDEQKKSGSLNIMLAGVNVLETMK